MATQNPFPAQADIYGFQTITRTCSEVDQVWLFTGNFIKRVTLIDVPTIGYPLALRLTYNSQDTVDGPLGNGFRHNYMIGLTFTGGPPTHISYTASTGIQYGFIYDSDTDTWGPDGASYFFKGSLSQVGSSWNIVFPDGSYCQFNSDGLLTSMVDSHGNMSTMAYVGGQLSTVTEPTGRNPALSYTGSLMTGVTDPRGNEILLTYTDGNLTQVTYPSGCYSNYGWSYLDTYGQWMLTSRTDANGTYTYSYEDTSGLATSGRLTGVTDAESTPNSISYTYHQPSDETPVIEYLTDASGGTPTAFVATVLTDALGNAWQYDFDLSGNMWRVFQPSLAASPSQKLSHWRHYYWDNNQQLLYASGGFPMTYEYEYGPAPGSSDSINNVFHRYAYDNNYGFNGNSDPDNETGDSQGLLLYEADETGMITAYAYDDNQNVTSIYPGQAHLGVQGNWVGQYGSHGYVMCNFLGDGGGEDLISSPTYIDTGNITMTPDANVTITQQNMLTGGTNVSIADSRCLMSPTGPDRNIGWWSADGTFTVSIPFSGGETQSFNLSVYTNSVDQGYFQAPPSLPPIQYWEQFGRDVTLTVLDSTGSEQVFRVTNTAPGIWVTFPVTMNPGDALTLTVSASGVNLLSGSPDCRISALAFDSYASRRTLMTYTEQNDVATIVDPLGNLTSLTYNPSGTVATLTNARSAVTHFYYEDAVQNLTRIVDALSNTERRSYDENGNLVQRIDARGYLWLRVYDEQNRLISRSDPLSSVTTWSYTGPNLVTITDANNNETNFAYTPCGRLWTVTNALDGVTTLGYDGAGNVVSAEDPKENVTGFTLDALMRVVTLTRPDGNSITYGYDALDRLRAVTPPNGNVPAESLADIITTNAANLLSNGGAEVADPFHTTQAQNWSISSGSRDTTEHFYGTASFKVTDVTTGNVQQASVAVPPGVRTLVTYQAMTNASSGSLTLTTSILTSPVDGDVSGANFTVSPSWDLDVYSTWAAAPPVRLDVPGDGQYDRYSVAYFVIRCSDGPGGSDGWLDNIAMCPLSQALSYDGAGRPVKTEAATGAVVTRVRDRFGRVVAIQDARRQQTTLTYDSLDRILSVTSPLGETMSWTYDGVGNVLTFEDPNTNVTSYTTDLLNRLTVITYPDTTEEHFSYDPVSNLIQYIDNIGNVRSMSYDPANRLTVVTYEVDSTTVMLSYDRIGNVLFRTDRNGDVTNQVFDALNRGSSGFRVGRIER